MTELNDLVNKIDDIIMERSKQYNDGSFCYPSAYGSLIGNFRWILNDLRLNKKQMEVLENHINKINKVIR